MMHAETRAEKSRVFTEFYDNAQPREERDEEGQIGGEGRQEDSYRHARRHVCSLRFAPADYRRENQCLLSPTLRVLDLSRSCERPI